MTPPILFLTVLVVLIGSVVRGITAIGSALVVTSLGLLFLPPLVAVSLAAVTDVIGNAIMCYRYRREMLENIENVIFGIIWCCLGAVFAILLAPYTRFDVALTSSVLLIFASLYGLFFDFDAKGNQRAKARFFAFLGGSSSVWSGLPGPFVAMSLLAKNANNIMTSIFPILFVMAIIRFVYFESDYYDSIIRGLLFVPVILIGLYIGMRYREKMPVPYIATCIYVVCFCSGLISLAKQIF